MRHPESDGGPSKAPPSGPAPPAARAPEAAARAPTPERRAPPLDVSIVIVAPRTSAYLREALAAIAKLHVRPRETIVVLDEAPQTPLDQARCIVSGPLGPAQKRDLAAAAASGALLAFLDDDAYPHPRWLDAALPHFQDPRVWAVGGPGVTPPHDGFRAQVSGWTYASWIVSGPVRHRYAPGRRRRVDDHPSMNFIMRRSAFLAVGGFASAFYPGEDTKLCLEIVRRGGLITYEPRALVYHHRRPVMRGHLQQIAQYGRHRGYFARVFPATSRRLPYFVLSLWLVWLPSAALASIWLQPLRLVVAGTLLAYGAAVLVSAGIAMHGARSMSVGAAVAPTIAASHLTYGWNFLTGLLRRQI